MLAVAPMPAIRPDAVGEVIAQSPAAPEPKASAPLVVPLKACRVSGTSRVLAPAAVLSSGIEARALSDDEVALAFASTDHAAVALRFDPSSSSSPVTAMVRSRSAIRRASPILSPKGTLGVAVDVDAKNDPIDGRRTLMVDPPVQVGTQGGTIVWAHQGGSPAGTLWSLDGPGEVQALRGAFDPTRERSPIALVFRQGSTINLGLTDGGETLAAQGGLLRFEGLGESVGSPALAMNDGVVVAVWADRASADTPWSLRWTHFKAGQAPAPPTAFDPPLGESGEQAMSPAIAAIAGKRFLLVWTEGPASGHDVRAVTLSEEGELVGAPLSISSVGSNAGQGQAVVTAAGHGIVAFLESSKAGFHVAGTPIVCDM